MPLSGSCFWGLVLPVETTNLITDSSFERGTQGWGTIQAGTIGTTSQYQQFGAWAGSVAPTSNGTTGVRSPTFTAGNGTTYTASAYIRGADGIPYRFGVGDSNGASMVGSITFTGGGTWHRYSFSWTEASGATRALAIKKNSSADTSAFYIDGVQVEANALTTYIDGDQDGCYWLGLPHQSQSTRSGTYRGGGSVVALADLGLKPDEHLGIGMPPQEITALSYALLPGAEYQRSRAGERPFTLTFSPILGTSPKDFHVTRRTIINAIKPDLVDPQQPVRFWYTGGQGTVQIDAVYQSGLELGEMDGPMAENGAVSFIAHDPYWYATTQEGTSLAPRTAVGSINYLGRRSPSGVWGSLGPGNSVNGTVRALEYYNGTMFVGGEFNRVNGTISGPLAMYFPQTNTFGTMGGTVDAVGVITSIVAHPSGTIYFGGAFNHISGLSNTRHNAQWTSAGFGTMQGGTANTTVSAMVHSRGTIFLGGAFTQTGGIANTRYISQWSRTGYTAINGGTTSDVVTSLAVGLDRTLYVGGIFGSADGTAANFIAQWGGAWGTMGVGFTNNVSQVETLTVGPNGVVYAGGGWGSAGGGSALNTGQWNGVQWFPMAGGLGDQLIAISQVFTMYADPDVGNVYAAGAFDHTGPRRFPQNHAEYNGYTWLPFDLAMTSNADTKVFTKTPDGALYVGGMFAGTAFSASVTTIVNTGMAEAYPTLVLRNFGVGTASLYQLHNTLTGDRLFFNYQMEPGETVTLNTTPGQRSLTSDQDGNVFRALLPGSNLSSFKLMPGTNTLSLFLDSGSVSASVYWDIRSDSVDGGTIV